MPSRDVDYGETDVSTAPIDKGGDSPGILVAWPRTFEEDWCGEWVRSDCIAGQVKATTSQQRRQTEQQSNPAPPPQHS